MSILSSFLRSLLLTSILSFVAPWIIVGSLILGLLGLGYIPGLATLSQASATQVLKFLAVFGTGSSLHGLFVLGLTTSLVGTLFDAYAFYQQQNFRER